MRIATTLLLGAAVLASISAMSIAQGASLSTSLSALPAVPPLKSGMRQAAIASSPSGAAVQPPAPQAGDAPPTTQSASPPDAPPPDANGDPAVQEAKNNGAGVIDATTDKHADDSDSVIATVNDESISEFELRQRVALYLALQGITQQLTPEQRTRMRTQILDVLESERVQLQEAVKKKITVSPI
jgi:peptidyl-prolyl cis-trans isomerase SurA